MAKSLRLNSGQDTLHEPYLMISDWSGAALDYAFGLNKPVLFVDVPRKVNNSDYGDLEIESFESAIREKIGMVSVGSDVVDKLGSINIAGNVNTLPVYGIE